MEGFAWIGVTLLAAILAAVAIRQWARANGQANTTQRPVRVLGMYSPTLTSLRYRYGSKVSLAEGAQALLRNWALVLELGVIVAWGVWVTQPYLNMDPSVWPNGSDFPRNIQLFFQWRLLPQCGACVFWNGSINGGAPAFADNFTPVLYPPMILATLIWGTLNGAKMTLVLSFIIAGLAQWWLARVLGLGRLARLWSALMAVAGGQLSSRMQMGHIVMVTSISAASLVLAPALQTALTGRRRPAILFGIMMALALVAGHGYIQIGMLFGLLPALLIFAVDSKLRLRPQIIKAYLLAAGVTVLLAAIYWLPLIHFWGHLQKDGDPTFGSATPVLYALMNLVINDNTFFNTTILGHTPYPAMYMMFISWVPVALAVVAVRLIPRERIKIFVFLVLAIFLIYYASSADLFKRLGSYGQFFSLGRIPSLMAPLAVPLILALAAWGLDELLKRHWPRMALSLSTGGTINIPLALVLVVPLAWGLWSVYQFGQSWINTSTFSNQDFPSLEFKPGTTQWVAIPFGDLNYIDKAQDAGLKILLYRDFTAWNWVDRDPPPPFRELTRDPNFATDPAYQTTVNGVLMLEHPQNQYASVQTAGGPVPCTAVAMGGNIDVNCQTSAAGTLTVQENMWPGWSAKLANGLALALGVGPRLTVDLPPGTNHIIFRYRPWDVTIGLLLTLLGVVVAVWLWLSPGLGWRDDDRPATGLAGTGAAG